MTATRFRILPLLLAALAALPACPSGGKSDETVPDDLTGEWDVLQLVTNGDPGWRWMRVSVAASGDLQFLDGRDWNGPLTGTPPAVRATLDAAGTVRLTGADGEPTFHGVLAESHALVVGTADETDGGVAAARELWVWRRRVAGVTYRLSDLAGHAFTYQAIYAGPRPRWERGAGNVDASGTLSITSGVDSLGTVLPAGEIGALAVDGHGIVTMPGAPLMGVLTRDRAAAILVNTSGDQATREPALLVLLVAGASYAQADLAGTFRVHALTSGTSVQTSLWQHGTLAVDAAGAATFSEWADSNGNTTLPASLIFTVSDSGAMTSSRDASFLGQLSSGKDLYVRTSGTASLGLAVR